MPSVVKRSERRVCFGHCICLLQLRYEPGSQSRVTSALDGKGHEPRVRKARLRSVVLHLQKAQRGFSPLPVAPVEVPVAEPVVGGAVSVLPGGRAEAPGFSCSPTYPTHRTGKSWRPCQPPPAYLWVRYRCCCACAGRVIMVPLATSIATIVVRMESPPHRSVLVRNAPAREGFLVHSIFSRNGCGAAARLVRQGDPSHGRAR